MAAPSHRARLLSAAAVPASALRRADSHQPAVPDPSDESWTRAYRVPLLLALLAGGAISVVWLASTTVLDGAEWALDIARDGDGATGRAVVTTLLAAAVLLVLVARWESLSAPRRPLRLPGGGGLLSVDDLAALLRYELTVPGTVAEASVRVENRHRSGVAVWAVVEVGPETRLSRSGVEVRERLTAILERRLGLVLAAPPRVELRYSELLLRPGAPSYGIDRAWAPRRSPEREGVGGDASDSDDSWEPIAEWAVGGEMMDRTGGADG